MAEKFEPQPPEVIRYWIESIFDEASDKLNDWERNFVEVMRWKIHDLTENQQNKLEQLYVKYTK